MKKVTETDLPGLGARFEFQTDSGRGIGVVAHQTGRRDLVIYDDVDPDRAAVSVELTEDEGHTLGELLGANPVIQQLEDAIHRVSDLAIAWIAIDPSSEVVGMPIGEAGVRTRTGAGVVAVISEEGSTPVPGGDHVLNAGDTAIVVGLPPAVAAAKMLLDPAERSG